MTYAIKRVGARRFFEEYNTIEELQSALKYYGLPEKLSQFQTFDNYGMSKNNYQNYAVLAYKE